MGFLPIKYTKFNKTSDHKASKPFVLKYQDKYTGNVSIRGLINFKLNRFFVVVFKLLKINFVEPHKTNK